jgi:hypothetical protein
MLLVAVVLAFLIDLFDIQLTDIPLGGFETRVDPGVLPLLIFIIVLYFTIAFGIAIIDDVMNTPTPHVLETYNSELLTRLYEGLGETEKEITDYLSEYGAPRGLALKVARTLSYRVKNIFPASLSRETIEQLVRHPLNAKTAGRLPADFGVELGRKIAEVTAPVIKDYRRPKIGPYLHFFYARLYGFEIALPATLAIATLILYFRKIDLAWLGIFSAGG